MYARILEIRYDPDKVAQAGDQGQEEWQAALAQQPGYRAHIRVDARADTGEARYLLIVVHDTEEQSQATLPSSNEEIRRLSEAIAPTMTTTPVQQLGEGMVVFTDLTPAGQQG